MQIINNTPDNVYSKCVTHSLYVTDVNDCASNPCQNGGSCSDMVNDYDCLCLSGYIGIRCEIGRFYAPAKLLDRS